MKVIGQKRVMRTLHEALRLNRLPAAILMFGPESSGKLEAVQTVARTLFCREKKDGFCGRCADCLKVHKFQHPNFISVLNDDRLKNIQLYVQQMRQQSDKENARLRFFLQGEWHNLLSRHELNFLQRVDKKKQSYPEGVKLDQKKYQETLEQAYHHAQVLREQTELDDIFYDSLLDLAVKLQNSLDRTVLTRDFIAPLKTRVNQASSGPKLVHIQNIHKIPAQIVGFFLKLLEDPPDETYFILSTIEAGRVNQQVLVPLKSRCLNLEFQALSAESQKEVLQFHYNIKTDDNQLLFPGLSDRMDYLLDGAEVREEYIAFIKALYNRTTLSTALMDQIKKSGFELETVIKYFYIYQQNTFSKLLKNESKNLRKWTMQNRKIEDALLAMRRGMNTLNISSDRLWLAFLTRLKTIV